ncbi:hypothetical protein ACQP25_44610 (plasmid) [Microtetraspora malaysiensis]|uniref:hypothetical protein n=1 Tax=Microtetraspora malaysiensis TaxID=161358 RepID=UPI003D924806
MSNDTTEPRSYAHAVADLARITASVETALGELDRITAALSRFAPSERGPKGSDMHADAHDDARAQVEQAKQSLRHLARIAIEHRQKVAETAGRPTAPYVTVEYIEGAGLVVMAYRPYDPPYPRTTSPGTDLRRAARTLADDLGMAYLEPTDPAVLALLPN